MKKNLKGINYSRYGYIFSIPFIAAFLIFNLYPTIYTVFIGFTDCKGLGNTDFHILDEPFKNFDLILHNESFKTSLKNTFSIWIMNFIPQITLALVLSAWFTSHRHKLRGQGFFKVVFYMPNIITAASIAILFGSLFGYPIGPVNDLLTSINVLDKSYFFLNDKTAARLIVAFIQFWTWYGYTMLILISGILGINPEIFEAAEIDGASNTQTFLHITLPNLKTILLYTLVTSLVGGLQMFDIPKLFVVNGGPDQATLTTSVFIHSQAFSGSYMYNRAAAASMLLFLIIAVCSAFVFFIMRDKDEVNQKPSRKKVKSKGGY